jgi:antitoxin component of MazEF toxin-antitoxin module
MPQSLLRRLGADTGEAVLRYEIMGEQAAALGRAGRKVELALAALKDATPETHAERLKQAADVVWGFLIQRELMGLRDRERIVAEYAIPRAVMARLGAR